MGKPILNKDLDGKPRKLKWKYRTAVGMLSYLQGNSRPEISMAVHQTARFCNDPKLRHEQAIMRLGRYLLHTKDKSIIFEPDKSKGLICFVDADFAGGWSTTDSTDADNVMSTIYRCSKLQTEIALSTAEAEYIDPIPSAQRSHLTYDTHGRNSPGFPSASHSTQICMQIARR